MSLVHVREKAKVKAFVVHVIIILLLFNIISQFLTTIIPLWGSWVLPFGLSAGIGLFLFCVFVSFWFNDFVSELVK